MRVLTLDLPQRRLCVEDRGVPAPGPGEAVIQVLAVGVCGSDLHGITGENGRRAHGQVMGHELAGRLAAGSAPVPGAKPGDLLTMNPVIGCGTCGDCASGAWQICSRRRVIGVDPSISAGFAEYIAVPVPNVVPLGSATPAWAGALVEPLSVGYHAAVRGLVDPGTALLVIGGGPVGQAAAVAGRRLGVARTLVLEPSEQRRRLAGALGFMTAAPHDADAGMIENQLGCLPGVVIDAVGTAASLSAALRLSARGAAIVLVGMHSPSVTIDTYPISTDERTLIGSFCYSEQEFRATAAWVDAHHPELTPLVDKRVTLEQAPAAVDALVTGARAWSKVMIEPAR